MAFSGALTLTDLNDFITPSQACIKPVEVADAPQPVAGGASTEIQVDDSGAYHELEVGSKKGGKKKLQKAEISLNDCLACSGCITSAESVLITQQSHLEVLSFLGANAPPSSPDHSAAVLSIAPQSLASLAASLSPVQPLHRVLRRVQAFCKQELGFDEVYDTTFARHLSLLELRKEFAERKANGGTLPMLSSACPGWVCYAEKTHAEMIPFMSKTKSPQQVMGTLVKNSLAGSWSKTPDKVYHVTVMPCYDKKLEASRTDFFNDIYSTRDVDCVLTTGELQLLMQEKGWDLSKPVQDEDLASSSSSAIPELIQHQGTSSGSYLHTIIESLSTPSTLLSTKLVRNSTDYEEFILKDVDTDKIIFRGAKCYGFRNLQNVVRKVGRDAGVSTAKGAAAGAVRLRKRVQPAIMTEDSRGYDFVEVMACPSGCVNGGGQLRPQQVDSEGLARDWDSEGVSELPSAKWGDKAWTARVEAAYWGDQVSLPPTPPRSPKRAGEPTRAEGIPGSVDTKAFEVLEELDGALLRTEYRAVESDVVGITVQW